MSQSQIVKLALAAVATVLGFFVLDPDVTDATMRQLLLAGTVMFIGLEVALP